jgi:hypothetical protein
MRYLNPNKTAVMDHNAAVADAVAWLGNRYLLATPARRLTQLECCNADVTPSSSAPGRSRSSNNQLQDARDQKSAMALDVVAFPAK